MADLKPCPFCGARADFAAGLGWFSVECSGCGVETDAYTVISDAQAVWNRRATLSAGETAPAGALGAVLPDGVGGRDAG
jgi:hypothetical protein